MVHEVEYNDPKAVASALENATNTKHKELYSKLNLNNFASVVDVADLPGVSSEK